jgi:hypothetical protein
MWLLAQIEPVLVSNGFCREPDSACRFSKVCHPLMLSIEEHRYRGWQTESGTTVKFLVSVFNPIGNGPLMWPVVLTAWFQGDHVASLNPPSIYLISTKENRPDLAKQFVDVGLRWTRETLSIEWVANEIARRIQGRRQLVDGYRRTLKRWLSFGQPLRRESPYDDFCASLVAWHLGDVKKALVHAEDYAAAIGDAESRDWVQFVRRAIPTV